MLSTEPEESMERLMSCPGVFVEQPEQFPTKSHRYTYKYCGIEPYKQIITNKMHYYYKYQHFACAVSTL